MQYSFVVLATFVATTWAQANDNVLKENVIQTASAKSGLDGQQEQGQAASLTSNNNFIDFCSGKTLTNGQQIEGGSCNSIPMGDIPAKNAMVSAIIQFPESGGEPITAGETFDVKLKVANLQLGEFTNPKETYYSAPQQVKSGKISGHIHVTVQTLGQSLNPTEPPDASQFVFFKGINVAGERGVVSATVTGGLPAGFYRVCTLASAANHQPVIMPLAQRGAQDDCTKFQVGGQNGAKDQNDAKDEQNQVGAKAQNDAKDEQNQVGAKAQNDAKDEQNQVGAKAQNDAKDEQNQVGAKAQNDAKDEQNQVGAKAQNGGEDEKNQAGAKAQSSAKGQNDGKGDEDEQKQAGAKGNQASNKNQKNDDDDDDNKNSNKDNGKNKAAGKENDKRRRRAVPRIYVS